MPFLPPAPSGKLPIQDKRQTFESEGMKLPAFGSMLVLAAIASLGAVALDNAPLLGGTANGSVPTTSAEDGFFSLPGGTNPGFVTERQPSAANGTEPQDAVAPLPAADATDPDSTSWSRAEAGALSTSPVAPPTASSLPSGISPPVSVEPIADKEFEILDAMNGARLELGLQPLIRYSELDEVALSRARHLVKNGYFDHYAPDGTSAFSELAVRGLLYRLAGENLARNNYPANQTVVAAFEGLMASPGHRANILEPMFGAVGVAVVRDGNVWVYVTIFTNPR